MVSGFWVLLLLIKCNFVISDNIKKIYKDIEKCSKISNKNSEGVILIGASKAQSIEKIKEAFDGGVKHFGENYLQEAEEKIKSLQIKPTWHFIGSIQSRKAKRISEIFDWVHTVDSYKIAKKLSDSRPATMKPLNVCIQLNIDNEETKSGTSVEDLEKIILELQNLDNLNIRGLMVIPKQRDSIHEQRLVFKKVKDIHLDLITKGYHLDSISMGMSSDYGVAIEEGATMIRVGTGIFGMRR